MRRTTIYYKDPQTPVGAGDGQQDPAISLDGLIDSATGCAPLSAAPEVVEKLGVLVRGRQRCAEEIRGMAQNYCG